MQKRGWLFPLVLTVFFLVIIGTAFASLTSDTSTDIAATNQETTNDSPNDLDGLIEEVDKRQINSKTYLDPVNKLHKAIIDMKPVHYKDSNGKWQDIVLELKESSDSQYRKEYHQGDISIKLSDKSRPQDMVSIKNKDKEITFAPIDDSSMDITLPRNVNKDLQTPNGAFGTRAANFDNVYLDIDFRYELKQDALKEIIYINKPTTKNVFKFLIKANGLDAKLNSDNSVSFTDSQTNSLIFDIQKSFATDSSNKPEVYKDLSTGIEKQGSHYILTLTLDPNWLSDPDRVYPIIIDPTTKYYIQDFTTQADGPSYGLMTGKAAKVYEYSPTTNYATDNLSVGENASSYDWRMYVQVNPTSSAYALLSDKRILTASQELYMYGQSDTSNRVLYMYKLSETWGESAITWNNKPNFNSTSVANETTGSNFDWKKWDITSIFDNWQSNPTSNHGLLIKIDNNNYNEYKQFYGDEYEVSGNKSAKRPRLVVSYTSPPTASVSSPTGDQWTTDSTPTFTWNYTDPDTDEQNKYRVQASQSSNFSTLAFDTGNVTSSIKSYTPTTPLADGTYYWRVTVYDSYDWSGWTSSASNNGKFKVDATAPTGTLSINNGSQYTTSSYVTLNNTYSDSYSGVSMMRFSHDGTNWNSWKTAAYSEPSYSLIASPDGLKTEYAQFKDYAGNVSPATSISDTISLDTNPPVGTFTINNDEHYSPYTNVALDNIYATDLTSGIFQMRFSDTTSFNGASWQPFNSTSSFNLSAGDGDKTIYAQFKDNSGNITTQTITDSINLNPTKFSGIKRFWSYSEVAGLKVNLQTGNLIYQKLDTSIPGRGPELELTRTYNSKSESTDTTYGLGWSISTVIKITDNTSTVELIDADGSTNIYKSNGDNSYTSPPGDYRALVKTGTGSFMLTEKDQTKYYFTNLRLTSIADSNSNTLTITYDGNGKVDKLTDASGRVLDFNYDTNSRLATIVDPANRTTTYAYDTNGRLTSVTNAENETTTYIYNGSDNLTGIKNPMNATTTISYNQTSENAENIVRPTTPIATTSYSYSTNQTDVTDPNGNITTYKLNTTGQTINQIDPMGATSDPETPEADFPNDEAVEQAAIDDYTAYWNTLTDSVEKAINEYQPVVDGRSTTMSYDANYNLLEKIDKDNSTTKSTYDSNGNQLTFIDQLGKTTSYSYNSNNLITTITPSGETTTNSYNIYNNLTSVTDAENNKTTYGYDSYGNRIWEVSPRGNAVGADPDDFKTNNIYDSSGNYVIRIEKPVITYPDQTTSQEITSSSYNTNTGKKITDTDSMGNITYYGHDNVGRQTYFRKPTNVDGSEAVTYIKTVNTYDDNGNKIKDEVIDESTNEVKSRTEHSYNAANQLTSDLVWNDVNDSSSIATSSYTYDANGNKLTEINPIGGATNYQYDLLNRTTKTIKPDNNFTAFKYNSTGAQVKESENNGTVVILLSKQRNEVAIGNPLGKISKFIFDLDGNQVKSVDSDDITTISNFSRDDELISVTDTNQTQSVYQYDENNNQTMTIFNNQNPAIKTVTTISYNESDDTKQESDQLGNSSKITYNNLGLETKIDQPNNKNKEIDYTPNGSTDNIQATGILTNSANIDFEYDALGNVTSTDVKSALSGNTIAYSDAKYDSSSNLKQLSDLLGVTMSFSYNKAGGLTSINDSISNDSINYFYNTSNTLMTVSYKTNTNKYTYDTYGNKAGITLSNGGVTSISYDSARQITFYINKLGSTTLSSYNYQHDNIGNILSTTETNGTTSYSYDDLSRLTNVVNKDGSKVTYSYDTLGNRLAKRDSSGTTSYDYNDANELTDVNKPGGEIITYSNDNNGNLLTEYSTTSGTTSFSYDNSNNLVKVIKPNNNIIEFVYDGRGNRYSKTVTPNGGAAVTTYYQYDARGNIVLETDANKNIIAKYIRDNFGKAVSMEQNNQMYYFIYNAHGDVTSISDSNGNTTATYTYDEFGNLKSSTGSIYNPLRYSGANNAYFDSETSLYKMGVRYYKPEIGRWINRDPYKGENEQPDLFNKYVYCLNNPVTNIDPTGNVPLSAKEHKAKIRAWSKICDLVWIPINELSSVDTYKYKDGVVSEQDVTSKAWCLAQTGWFISWGPDITIDWPNPNDGTTRTQAGYQNDVFPGGPYSNFMIIKITARGDGSFKKSRDVKHTFGISDSGKEAKMKTKKGSKRTKLY